MKNFLKCSTWLNVILLGVLIYMLSNRHPQTAEALPTAAASQPGQKLVLVTTQSLEQNANIAFKWSQLESTNSYRTYVANLRAAGCPEPTVQDIVNGDVARTFAFRRRQQGLDGSGTGLWSRAQETELITRLLGATKVMAETSTAANQTGPGAVATQTPASLETAAATVTKTTTPSPAATAKLPWVQAKAPVYPVAFQSANLNSLPLNNTQKAAIQQVQQQFINEVGGPNQNPADPAYLARWQLAQNHADAALRAALGVQAYMDYQLQHYYNNFQSLMINSGGNPGVINPDQLAQ